MTGIALFEPGEGSLFSVIGVSADAATLAANFLATGDLDASLLDGNDRIFGGGGRDLLAGMDGRDQMTGGTASDLFVFQVNKGVDTVIDFADTAARGDDYIAVTRNLYDRMVMTQQGSDVLLDFGRAGAVLVLDQAVAEMGVDDFWFKGLPF